MFQNKESIIANCGLVCSECKTFIKGKCKGCHSDKPMYASCPVRKCNFQNKFRCCSECKKHEDLKSCKKLNSMISKIIGFFTGTNRIENLHQIRKEGYEKFKNAKRNDKTC